MWLFVIENFVILTWVLLIGSINQSINGV